jgi:diaminohydroxyphosphoribosylaminopyrimidine deaminase/5-amino-6-(5-phosphoribosylamino)uracil reductase
MLLGIIVSSPMQRAIELAQSLAGVARPNPTVAAVLFKDGEIISEGTTEPGGAHAEVVAIRKAGENAKGSTLYVTLEPCCHYGKTPPCTDAVISAGIESVHIAILDPNPLIAGQGMQLLESSGITTFLGAGKEIAQILYETHAKYITLGTPFVTAKYAMSLDGKIATHSSSSQWITGPEARQYAHMLRGSSDAVAIGIGTAVADDPLLTVRTEQGVPFPEQPVRVVVDTGGRLPSVSRMLYQPGKTIIACSSIAPGKKLVLEEFGAEILELNSYGEGVDLLELLKRLGAMEITSILVEGGSTLLGSLFDQNLVDKVVAFVAPKIIGGKNALTAIGGEGVNLIDEAIDIQVTEMKWLGTDMVIQGYPGGGHV